ncbi:5727_t:CDS:2 [Cetraspora pellucida]|uniref:5727_t:CDS:1 n=1 Tax=Cetraspora pellucida TaxID=1433469 RepID=A0A9N9NV49_9GLOM|nr:5727_t:CDS:2 [Cetraspora pellucida]
MAYYDGLKMLDNEEKTMVLTQQFYEAIDEEATFITEFKETWQTFMLDCFLKMFEETLDEEKKLVRITNLDCLILNYDIYDTEGILNLNDADFKQMLDSIN